MNDAGCAAYYHSLNPVTDEVRALADVVHGSATELGRTVAKSVLPSSANWYPMKYQATGDGTADDMGVSTAYRESSTRRVLLTVNEWNQETVATFKVVGLKKGDRVQVLFENREVVVERDGILVDTFKPYARHVYVIPKWVPLSVWSGQ
jgi:hypothetical protein